MDNEKGYLAQCISVGATVKLEKYEHYYVYPNGADHFYVSKFPYPQRSYFGCYSKLHFKLEEPIIEAAADLPKQEVVSAPKIQEQMSLF